MLFLTSSCCLESNALARRINLVYSWTFFNVASDQSHNNAKSSDSSSLCHTLQKVAQIASKYVNWHFVSKIVFEFRGLLSQPRDYHAAIIHVSHNHSTDVIADVENTCDRIAYNQRIRYFLLSANHYWIHSSDRDRSLAKRLSCFECVFELVDAPIRSEHLHHLIHSHLYFKLISLIKMLCEKH